MWEAILSGLTLGFILALSVGPVIFTIVKQSINNGHVGGFSFVAGVWLSDILLVVICNAFSSLVSDLLEHKQIIAYTGSVFLVAMGVYYLLFKKIKLKSNAEGTEIRFTKFEVVKLLSSGFLINTLNPTVFIFWLTTATTFAVKYSFKQRLLIFAVCLVFNVIADTLKVVMAGKLRNRLTLHNIALINKVSGTILIAFGLALLYSAVNIDQII